ncbi:murein biosynthesis integral membrane protein MurJ [Catenuloplanes atrovinosus]|uniref:Peptidoglycan lipid II flippase n=1 Tax=Catenuloplanes atrovinosus TaxID=137266 RepID=A0AAE4CFU9_9ACTN|nr:murein biosynthesis integral membrane protein MurJ [Catenuloplanes atrovinosus]MDR7280035.1 putative peptidoglycan lipid II flippase [Catenuloplanes atrovinosus]
MTGGLYRSSNAGHRDGPYGDGQAPPLIDAEEARLTVPDTDTLGGTGEVPGAEPPSGGGSTAGNSLIMAAGSLVSRGTGFLRTVVLTSALGAAVGDAYTTAQIFPGLIYEFLLGGILSSVLLPLLVRRRKSDPDGGQAFTQTLLSLAVIMLAVATVIAVAAAPLLTMIYASEESTGEYRDLVTSLSHLMLPMIFFTGVSALFSAVLNTRGHFAAPMWTPILNNIIVIAAGGAYLVLYGASKIDPGAMTADRIAIIGGGTLLGMAVQAAGLIPALRKVGFRWKWRFNFGDLGLRELGRLGAWMICYVVVNQIGLIVVFNLLNRAGSQGETGPLMYNNVYLLLMMAHGIIAVSIITALMPRMSAAAADGRLTDIAEDLSRGMRTATAALAPVAVVYGVLAAPIMVTLFGHGAIGADDAAATSIVLISASIALIPFSVSQLFTFANYAMSENRTAALVNVPVVAVRIAIHVACFMLLDARWVAAGLMIGNAVSYVVSAAISATVLRRRIGAIGMRDVAGSILKVMVAAAGSIVVGLLVMKLLPGDDTPSRLEAFLNLVVGGAAIGGAYLGLALLLRVREITQLLDMVKRRIRR